ncbi:MAG: hypothetical protein KBC35_02235 [Candidatus Pacebacteria bacterium]|nr:hypothetical protein [Candidatus Paceibacterota bacterium]
MPYIIAVLALVVVGVGFTLFQSPEQATDQPDLTSTGVIADAEVTNVTSTEEATSYEYETEDDQQDIALTAQPATVETTATTPIPSPAPTPTPTPAPAAILYNYRNGTYSSQISFRTPEGTYSMDVTMTMNNDVITSTDIVFDSKAARDGYTKRFNTSYQTYVIGKNLDTLNLSRIAGASLTTDAFKKAITEIKTQASA